MLASLAWHINPLATNDKYIEDVHCVIKLSARDAGGHFKCNMAKKNCLFLTNCVGISLTWQVC